MNAPLWWFKCNRLWWHHYYLHAELQLVFFTCRFCSLLCDRSVLSVSVFKLQRQDKGTEATLFIHLYCILLSISIFFSLCLWFHNLSVTLPNFNFSLFATMQALLLFFFKLSSTSFSSSTYVNSSLMALLRCLPLNQLWSICFLLLNRLASHLLVHVLCLLMFLKMHVHTLLLFSKCPCHLKH